MKLLASLFAFYHARSRIKSSIGLPLQKFSRLASNLHDASRAENYAVYRGAKCFNHLKILKDIWTNVLTEFRLTQPTQDIIIIDATCGNGHDSVFLANEIPIAESSGGTLWCIDIQPHAISSTRERLVSTLGSLAVENSVNFVCSSHESFPSAILPDSVSIICYNLGYLPGIHRGTSFDNVIKTDADTTSNSLNIALRLLKRGGMVSIISYPRHEGGMEETKLVKTMLSDLDPLLWRVYNYYDLNRPYSPSLFVAYRL